MKFTFPEKLAEKTRLPCLDGFRCISILFVLLSHSHRVEGFPESWRSLVRWIPDGGFGVQVFFVISGFLITYLLIVEFQKKNRVSLVNFYLRRAYRILPAYVAFLSILAAIQIFTFVKIPYSSWFALGTYLVNYIETPWIGAHVWSLSVEEQFYLLWPLSFSWALVSLQNHRLLFAIALVPVVMAPVSRVLGYIGGDRWLLFNPHSFLNHADSLAIGCLFALSLGTFGHTIEKVIQRHPRMLCISAILLIALPLVATRLFLLGPLTVPFASSLRAVGIGLMISLSLFFPLSPGFSWLNWRPVAAIGTWSYSIYLWQQIFCSPVAEFGFERTPWWLTFPAWLFPVFLIAIASYHLIERPFLRLRKQFKN